MNSIFCPNCGIKAPTSGEMTECGYERASFTCGHCKHEILVHDFGRKEL